MSRKYLDRLCEIAPPPELPESAPNSDEWRRIRVELGVAFPQELQQFCSIYGMGTFRGDQATAISIYCPWSGFVETFRYQCDRFRQIRGNAKNEDYPFGVFPEEGGILPLGDDECDDWLCWVANGDVQTWPILVRWTFGVNGMKTFEMPLSEFLVKVFERKIELPCWPLPWFFDDVRFIPYKEGTTIGGDPLPA